MNKLRLRGFHPRMINVPQYLIRITNWEGKIYVSAHLVLYVKLDSKRIIVEGIDVFEGMKPEHLNQLNQVGGSFYWSKQMETITRGEHLAEALDHFRRKTKMQGVPTEPLKEYIPGCGPLRKETDATTLLTRLNLQ